MLQQELTTEVWNCSHFTSKCCTQEMIQVQLYISRHLRGTTQCDQVAVSAEHYVNFVMTQATPKSLSRDDIVMATSRDATLQEVMRLPQMASGTACIQWTELIQVPLRSLQMFGINLPQRTVTLSVLVKVLSLLKLFRNVSLDKPIKAYSRPEAFLYPKQGTHQGFRHTSWRYCVVKGAKAW